MKSGILTYHNTRNCGASLQAYALSKVMENLGYDSKIVDYRCEEIEKSYEIKKIWELRSVKELLKWALTVNSNKSAEKKFSAFRKKYYKLSKQYNRDNIKDANEEFDLFITGSDQVWNFYLNGRDENYLLKFAENNKIKISYAASMGYSEIPEEFKGFMKDNLSTFNGISVREAEAKKSVDSLSVNSSLVLDPTLLLDKEEYLKLADNKARGKYIFVYTIANTPNIENKARELSKATGLPVIWGHMSYKKKKGFKNLNNLCCDEFLSLINGAEYVLTSSFHGMALSIILEKQFFYDLSVKPENNNSRLTTLSDCLELNFREMKADTILTDAEQINYDKVRDLLGKKREESLNFLKKVEI